jgi:hypothetical protein
VLAEEQAKNTKTLSAYTSIARNISENIPNLLFFLANGVSVIDISSSQGPYSLTSSTPYKDHAKIANSTATSRIIDSMRSNSDIGEYLLYLSRSEKRPKPEPDWALKKEFLGLKKT